jgi:phosphomannomutase/phosphoglucomutase
MTSSKAVPAHIFRAYDIRGLVDEEIDDEIAGLIGKAWGTIIRKQGGRRVAVGRDTRPSSPAYEEAFIAGARGVGLDVIEIGVVPSPVMYFVVESMNLDGGCNITASHNPWNYNGFKLVGKAGYPMAADDIAEVLAFATSRQFESGSGARSSLDPKQEYIDKVTHGIQLARPLRVALDAGNSVCSLFAPEIFEKAGCEVIRQCCDASLAPVHLPNPEDERNVLDLEQAVRDSGAELGLAFDGDGDRLGVIGDAGEYYEADYSLILLSRDLLPRHPGATILLDVKTSTNVLRDIERNGGVPMLWKTGHSFIKQKMRQDGILLGGELSGHLFVGEDYYPIDDATRAGLRLAAIKSRLEGTLADQFRGLPKLYATRLIEIPCPDDEKFKVVERVKQYLQKDHTVVDIDGARVEVPGGWGLIRASNTQPALTFRFEAASEEGLAAVREVIFAALETAGGIRYVPESAPAH